MKQHVIAITGSSGKTTTKEMLSSILERSYKTFKSYENGNDVWWTSQYADQIKDKHEMAVLEYGTKQLGEITQHCHIIKPDIGIITNIGKGHIGNFDDENGVVMAKSELIKGLKEYGILYLNNDDINSKKVNLDRFGGSVYTIGIKNNSDYQASDIKVESGGLAFQVSLDGENELFRIPVYGKHNVYNALFSIATAHQLHVNPKDIKEGLVSYYKPFGRLNTHKFEKDIVIINDTYNTKPCSMKESLNTLMQLGGNKQKIAVLGFIPDMGLFTEAVHKEIGTYIAESDIDYLYTISEKAEFILKGATDHGFAKSNVKHFQKESDLYKSILKKIKPNTIVLFNGYSGHKGEENLKMIDTVINLMNFISSSYKKLE